MWMPDAAPAVTIQNGADRSRGGGSGASTAGGGSGSTTTGGGGTASSGAGAGDSTGASSGASSGVSSGGATGSAYAGESRSATSSPYIGTSTCRDGRPVGVSVQLQSMTRLGRGGWGWRCAWYGWGRRGSPKKGFGSA